MVDIFCVTDTHTRKVVVAGFEKKIVAKEERNRRNEEVGSKVRFVISRGKDHDLGPTN